MGLVNGRRPVHGPREYPDSGSPLDDALDLLFFASQFWIWSWIRGGYVIFFSFFRVILLGWKPLNGRTKPGSSTLQTQCPRPHPGVPGVQKSRMCNSPVDTSTSILGTGLVSFSRCFFAPSQSPSWAVSLSAREDATAGPSYQSTCDEANWSRPTEIWVQLGLESPLG